MMPLEVERATITRRIAVNEILSGRRATPGAHHAPAPLIDAYRRRHRNAPADEIAWLQRTYHVAAHLHGDQMRKTGAPYITHPLAVATMLADLGADIETVTAALLHDTVEDTPYTLDECRADFGPAVALLVDGVTKLDGQHLGKEAAGAETIRKLVLTAHSDLRVLLIKLVDRLHNLRTLGVRKPASQRRIAAQTRELLVPMCKRLGLYRLLRETEDLCFRYLEPEQFAATQAAVEKAAPARDTYFDQLRAEFQQILSLQKIRATVYARPRHLYSVWDDHRDHLGQLTPGRIARVVIVVDRTDRDCWVTLGALHQQYPPISGRVRDYLATPKWNLYRSLHTTVHTPSGELVDVLIRTREMDEVAEDGIAATLRHGTAAVHRDVEWLQRLLSWQGEVPTEDYLDELRAELRAGSSIVVVAPDATLVTLPAGATGVDYAYARGEDVGARLIGIRVNGKLATITAPLANGDHVEALTTSGHGGPDPAWLLTARTAAARRAIRADLDTTQQKLTESE
jgi:GTP pyrophosphokinase